MEEYSATKWDEATLRVVAPEAAIEDGDTAPTLSAFPPVKRFAKKMLTPRHLWRKWYALKKQPLIITAICKTAPPTEELKRYDLDALLSVATLRWIPTVWEARGKKGEIVPRVVPLPLGLVSVACVVFPDGFVRRRIPVWACTQLKPHTAQSFTAICMGDADLLREILKKMPHLDGIEVDWSVDAAPLSEEQAMEIIKQNRPLPEIDERFSPPYWHNWMHFAPPPEKQKPKKPDPLERITF